MERSLLPSTALGALRVPPPPSYSSPHSARQNCCYSRFTFEDAEAQRVYATQPEATQTVERLSQDLDSGLLDPPSP